jgi:hypothetical protein
MSDELTVLDATPPIGADPQPLVCPYDDAREVMWCRGTYGYRRLLDALQLEHDSEAEYLISRRPPSSIANESPQLVVDHDLAAAGMTRQFELPRIDGRTLHFGVNEDGTRVAYRHSSHVYAGR